MLQRIRHAHIVHYVPMLLILPPVVFSTMIVLYSEAMTTYQSPYRIMIYSREWVTIGLDRSLEYVLSSSS